MARAFRFVSLVAPSVKRPRGASFDVTIPGGGTPRIDDTLFRTVFDESPVGMALVGLDFRFLRVNAVMCHITGYDEPELVEKTFVDITHPDDIDKDVALAERLMTGEIPHYQIEKRYVRGDGAQAWVSLGVSLVRDAEGRPQYFVATIVESTEQHRLREELARSERHYRALIENALDIIVVIDAAGIQRYMSPSVERVLGWRPEELVGRSAFDLLHPDDLSRAMAMFAERSAEPDSRETVELRMRHKDGRWLYLEAIGHNLLHDPAVGGVVLNSRDVTARRLAEERVAESERYFRALIEQVSDAITVLEPDGTIRFVSPQVERMLGYAPAELEGRRLLEIVHPDDKAQIAAEVAAWPIAPEEALGSRPARFRARHKDGSWRHIEGTGRISFDDPLVRGVIGSVRDVSDRVTADLERERLITELTEALAQVKTLEGLLPICSSCKRVRDDQGYWTQIDSYLSEHARTEFSHGICPRCAKQLYPEYFSDIPTDEIP